MHTRRFNFGKSHDASSEFAFKSALVVDLLLKISQPEISPVKDFETDATAFGQALAGKLYASFREFVGSNPDGPSVRRQFVGDFEFGELLNDTLRFLRVKFGIQRLVIDLSHEMHEYPQ